MDEARLFIAETHSIKERITEYIQKYKFSVCNNVKVSFHIYCGSNQLIPCSVSGPFHIIRTEYDMLPDVRISVDMNYTEYISEFEQIFVLKSRLYLETIVKSSGLNKFGSIDNIHRGWFRGFISLLNGGYLTQKIVDLRLCELLRNKNGGSSQMTIECYNLAIKREEVEREKNVFYYDKDTRLLINAYRKSVERYETRLYDDHMKYFAFLCTMDDTIFTTPYRNNLFLLVDEPYLYLASWPKSIIRRIGYYLFHTDPSFRSIIWNMYRDRFNMIVTIFGQWLPLDLASRMLCDYIMLMLVL